MMENGFDQTGADKYLVYQLGDELYATPIAEIRSVIEYSAAKPIPHTKSYFKGVINLRGEIVGVIDLSERLGIRNPTIPLCQLVFDTEKGPLAANVDRVHSVSALLEEDIKRKTSGGADSSASTERSYFLGVGKLEDRMLTLISLQKLSATESLISTP